MNCEYCNIEHTGSYGSGRFCSSKCARGFSTKAQRLDINKKVSKTLSNKEKTFSNKKELLKTCPICLSEHYTKYTCCSFKCGRIYGGQQNKLPELNGRICKGCQNTFKPKRKRQKFCSTTCAHKYKFKDPIALEKLSNSLKKHYSDPKNRKHLRDIGRKGGFGKKGITTAGTRYESLFEKEVFEYLENNNILFEAHKYIPNSSKVSDVYLPAKDLWIELDGINREKRKKWLGKNYEYWQAKLDLYEQLKLNFKIIYTVKEFLAIL